MSARGLLCATFLLCLTATLQAQTPDTMRTVRGRIVQIAGAELHIELITAPRLQAGDTLLLRRAGAVRGSLLVVAADSTRAVVSFAGAPFALTRGESIEAEHRRTNAAERSGAPVPVRTTAAPAEIPDRPPGVSSARRPRALGPHASGYISSETRWIRQRDAGASSSYGIPGATLSLRVSNLPASTTLSVFARAEYFGNDIAPALPGATRTRVYAARLETRAGPLRIGVGRLTSQHDPFGGPWDGIALEAGRRLSVVAEAGWEPEHGTAAPSARFPRVSLSAQTHAGTPSLQYRGSLAALRFLNDAPEGRGTFAVATRHSLQAGAVTVLGDLVAEKTDTTSMSLRWGGIQAALSTRQGARVHAGYRRYQPYGFIRTDTLIDLSSRARLEAGAYLPLGRTALNVNGAMTPGSETSTLSTNANLYVRALPGALELDLYGGFWQHSDATASNAGAGIGRTTGRLFTRAAYRIERGAERVAVIAHELDGEASLLIGTRSLVSASIVHSTARTASSTQFQLRLTWGF